MRRRWRQSWWSPSVSFAGASHAASNGRIRARGTAAPRSPSRNGSAGFFPLPPSGGIPRGTKKPSAAVLRDALGLTAAGRSLPGPRTAIEAAIGAARQQRKTTMAIIGTFTAADSGFGGSVKTLTLNFRAKFVPIEKDIQGARLSDHRRCHRMRRRLEEDRAGQRSRISLGQARRSEFSGADLCLAGERRG